MIITPIDLGNKGKSKTTKKKKKEDLCQENQLKGIGRRAKHLQVAWTLRDHVQDSENTYH